MNDDKKLTVLMPVYNAERHLAEAIESILGQTFKDFEFLIINDGSTDSSRDIIAGYDDSRIRLVDNDTNIGVTRSLNKGIELANTRYIARMDADDTSLPERLEKQVAFMERNTKLGFCGTWYRKTGSIQKKVRTPEDHNTVRASLLFKNTIGHSTVMIRKNALAENALRYDEGMPTSQDYDLWVRLAEVAGCANMPEICVLYRVYPEQISLAARASQDAGADMVRRYQLHQLGVEPECHEWNLHAELCHDRFAAIDLEALDRWFIRLIGANRTSGYFDGKTFAGMLSMKYWYVCKKQGAGGALAFRRSKMFMENAFPIGIKVKSILYGMAPVKRPDQKPETSSTGNPIK